MDGDEIVGLKIVQTSDGSGCGVVPVDRDGFEHSGNYWLSKQEAQRCQEKFDTLRRGGTRVFRCQDGGTPGFFVRGHESLNFVCDITGVTKK